MANLMHQHSNEGWSGDGNWWVDLNVYINGQNAAGNYSNITVEIVTYGNPGYSQNGAWVGQIWINGGMVANASSNRNIGTGGVQIAAWNGDVGHDANGNLTLWVEYYANMPVTSMSRRGANWGLTRIGYPPQLAYREADMIKPKSARLNVNVSNPGRGTSFAVRYDYRIQGSGTWIDGGTQAMVTGNNYRTITGLKSSKVYEYRMYTYTNNGDNTTTSVGTFKTKSSGGFFPVIERL